MNNNLIGFIQQFMANPMAMLARKYNIPQNLNDPQAIVQHLLNSGQIKQEDVNEAMQARNNPMFKGLFK